MLSLYEAAHLRTTNEYIMEKALIFTSSHLESLATDRTCPPHLSVHIRKALSLPQHWNMEMLFPVEYMSFYEQERDHDEMLFKFAKISFKLVQLQYLHELKFLTKYVISSLVVFILVELKIFYRNYSNQISITLDARWYKELEFASKLPPYFRQRIVENHFFVQAMCSEPRLSRARILMVQFFIILVLLDDTFDRYASFPEAVGLANSLERYQNFKLTMMMMMIFFFFGQK